MSGLGYRVSGFELFRLRRQVKKRSRVALFGLCLLAIVLACGSEPTTVQLPDPTPISTAAPTDLPVEPTTAPADTPVPQSPQPAAAAESMLPSTAVLNSLASLSQLVEQVKPAVASISVESETRGLFFDFTDEGAGSGVVVRPDGYIVTNFHVIQSATEIKVNLPSGESYDAKVVGRDRVTDLAIIKIDAEGLATVTFGDSDKLEVGDWLVAMGNALALRGGPTVTLGIVSARGRTVITDRGPLYDMIQTDAAINDGDSGGPLVNLDGEVVGINTAILRDAQGIGFAISSAVASPIIDSLIEHGRVVRPLIGLTGIDVTPAGANRLNLSVTEGIIVTRMSWGGPAFKAGIRVGDVIVKIDGIPTPDMPSFLTLLWTYEVGDSVQVEYVSNNETVTTTVDLVERPPDF